MNVNVEIPKHANIQGYPNSKRIWVTTSDFVFYIDGVKYVIPADFVNDLYSIPAFLHFWRGNNNGWGKEAAVIHDFMRRFRKLFGWSVKFTDEVFLEAMRLYDLDTANIKYRAVRLFAWATSIGSGCGKPSRKISRAMEINGDCWEEYRKDVMVFNKRRIK